MLSSGSRTWRLSAKSTIKATQAPMSSKQNKRLITNRARCPKLMYAKSAYVTRVRSTSRHLARILAVYDVVTAAKVRNNSPRSHPACFIARGKLNKPTPIKTFTELKIVCGTVDWPTTKFPLVPFSCCTCLTNSWSRSLSPGVAACACCSLWKWIACLRVASLTREEIVPYEVPKLLSIEVPVIPVFGIPLPKLGRAKSSSPSTTSESSSGRVGKYWLNRREPSDSASSLCIVAHSSSDPVVVDECRRGRTSGKYAALCHDLAKLPMLFTPPACLKRAENELGLVSVGSSFNYQSGSITFGDHHAQKMMTGSDYNYPIQTMSSDLMALWLAVQYHL